MRETKKKQIGDRGYTYHVTQFGARHGGRVLVRLTKMIGGAVAAAIEKDEAGFDIAVVGRIVASIAETVNEQDFDYLVETFAGASSVSGGEYGDKVVPLATDGVFDLHFAGAYKELGLWMLFAIEVNFSGFLPEGGIATVASDARQASEESSNEASKSRSPNTSVVNG